MCSDADLGARSRCVRLLWKCYRVRIDPVRAGEILNAVREYRDRGEHFRACLDVWDGPESVGRDDLESDKDLTSRSPIQLFAHFVETLDYQYRDISRQFQDLVLMGIFGEKFCQFLD